MPQHRLVAGLPGLALVLAAVLCAPAKPAFAATPEPFQLVADLEDEIAQRDSRPGGFTVFEGWVWFAADDGRHGRELWRTDGSQVERMTDICPGPCGVTFVHVQPFGSELLLFIADAKRRSRLLAIDESGEFRQIQEIGLGVWSEPPTELDGKLLFSVRRPESGYELWVTDATRAGTRLLADICPGECSSLPQGFTRYGNYLYFAADSPAAGRELWRTDGTEAGTELAIETNPGTNNGNPQALGVIGGRLLFRAIGNGIGVELWATDGSELELLGDLAPGFGSSWPSRLAQIGEDLLYMSSLDGGLRVWKTDGTVSGTVPAPELVAAGEPALGHHHLKLGDRLLFTVPGAGTFFDLWALELATLTNSKVASNLQSFELGAGPGGQALFIESGLPTGGRELRATDGTFGGTRHIRSFTDDQSVSADFTVLGEHAIFAVIDEVGHEPWITDVTAQGTRLLADVAAPRTASDPGSTLRRGEALLTVAGPRRRIWRIEDAGGAFTVSPESAGPFDRLIATPSHLYAVGSGGELWALDGDGLDPRLLYAGVTTEHVAVGERLYFSIAGIGQQLWTTDGTVDGTVLVTDIFPSYGGCQILCPGPPPTYPRELTGFAAEVFFFAFEDVEPLSLWRSDGTERGTRRVTTPPGLLDTDLVRWADGVTFVARADEQLELWTSDGSETRLFATLPPGAQAVRDFTPFDTELAFVVAWSDEREELWASDGTAAGTRRLTDFGVGTDARWALVDQLEVAADRLYAAAWNDVDGSELWVSSGLVTERLDLWPGRQGSGAADLTAVAEAGLVFAAVSDDGAGYEPWITTGTMAGTAPIGDLFPGHDTSEPGGFLADGERVVFGGDDGEVGRELFAFGLEAVGSSCDPLELCLHHGRFRVAVTWTDYHGQSGPGRSVSTSISSTDSGLFWFFDPDNWEMLVKVLDGCSLNGRFWVFAAATTDVAYTLTVMDTAADSVAIYQNVLGEASPAITDTLAFDTCP